MDKMLTSAIAANRFGLGARPGELAIGCRTIRAERKRGAAARGDGAREAGTGAFKKLPQLIRPIYLAEAGARFRQGPDSHGAARPLKGLVRT